MMNSVAYCCRDFVVNRRMALTANRLKAEPADDFMTYYFSKVQIEELWVLIGCMNQDGHIHGVSDLSRFSHFKTTFRGNH